MKAIKWYLIIFFIFILASCEANEVMDQPEPKKDKSSDDDFIHLVESNNHLSFSLLEHVDPNEDNNIFVSPTSALIAMLMIYNGANGETKSEIENALQLSEISTEGANHAIASLISMLKKDSEAIQLSVANSLWINETYHFRNTFTQQMTDYYEAKIDEINVHDDASAEMINEWVRETTHDKIDEIVETPLHPDLVAFLINALYFNGKWMYEFDESLTENSIFHTGDSKLEIPFMMVESELDYMENEQFQAVKLPYGKGEMSMQIFLPNETVQIDEFMQTVTEENWNNWQTKFQDKKGTVRMPKFQVNYEVILNEVFQQLGIELAFDEKKADFSKMIKEEDPLWIHEVKQKTFIDVNEKGTEAAGVTSGEMRTTSAPLDEPFYMEITRPFLFTIKDEQSGTILFIGFIKNPVTE